MEPVTAPAPLNISPQAQRRRAWPVKKFQPSHNPVSWDGLHRDPDLWFDDGDCIVHFYARGASRRGPSLRIHLSTLQKLQSTFLEQSLRVRGRQTSTSASSDAQSIISSEYDDCSSSSSLSDAVLYELYLPAPSSLPRGTAYTYHLTTRNCFAVALDLPIVGERLSTAMSSLWDRLQDWRCENISFEYLTGHYCKEQGYMDMSENPTNALTLLNLAEHVHSRQMYIDAFAHCVGMQQRLHACREFDAISDASTILVTKASLEMSLHIPRTIRSIGSFLEEELGSERLGLSRPGRDHLDRFRCCLTKYYIEAFGYFPPRENSRYNKRMWTKMYHSFSLLYKYLADKQSSPSKTNSQGMKGGVCVAQNVDTFDQSHGFAPLPYPLPLLPDRSAKATRRLTLDRFRLSKPDSALDSRLALEKATNSDDAEIMACPLVQEYQRFERQKLEDKIDTAEARKVRWLLVYGVLQMLTSIVCAPQEVRDADSPSYPMCVLTAGCPPWGEKVHKAPIQRSLAIIDEVERPSMDRLSIHPDCEAEGVAHFFQARARSEHRPGVSRTRSLRSNVNALQKSVTESMSRRNSLRWPLTPARKRPVSMIETATDYGNAGEPIHQDPLETFHFDLNEDEVISEPPQLDRSSSSSSHGSTAPSSPRSGRSSYSSNGSKIIADSDGEQYYSPITDTSSSWDESSIKQKSQPTTALSSPTGIYTPECYKPSGMTLVDEAAAHVKRASLHERIHSILSASSSEYSESDYEDEEETHDPEEEFRGRRRHRNLDRLSHAEMAMLGREICGTS